MKPTNLIRVLALFIATTTSAQTVSWDGGGDGQTWGDPLNWNPDAVPGPTDDVIISVLETNLAVVVTGNVTVQSVQCDESLILSNGTFTVTAGQSSVAGTLTIASGKTLIADGSTTTLTSSGPVLADGARLYARSGATLALPGLSTFTDTSGCCGTTLEANGAGSIMSLSGLTNLTGNPTWAMAMHAVGGGQMSLDNLVRIEPSLINLYADGSNSLINLPAFTDFPGTSRGISFEARNQAEINLPLFTSAQRVTFIRRNGGRVPLTQITRLNFGEITLDNDSPQTLPLLTNVDGSWLVVANGASLTLPNVTDFSDTGGCCGVQWQSSGAGSLLNLPGLTNLTGNPTWSMLVRAWTGGRIELSNLAQIASSLLTIRAEDTATVIDLSALTNFEATSGTLTLEAKTGGELQCAELTSGRRVNVIRRANSTLPINQFHNFILGSVTLEDGAATTLNNVTNIDGADLAVNNGSVLVFPNVPSFFDSSGCCGALWQANGGGSRLEFPVLSSFIGNPTWAQLVRAQSGGHIELPLVHRMVGALTSLLADGTNSQINCGNLSAVSHAGTALEARNAGLLDLTPGTFLATNATLTIQSGGQMLVGAVELYGGATLRGNGVLDAGVLNASGNVAPGTSAGLLAITGDYVQTAGGKLSAEIGGTTPGTDYDLFAVAGTASLDGTLQTALINSFAPDLTNIFTILTASSVTGAFSNYTGLDAGQSVEFEPNINPTEVTLSLTFATGPSVVSISPTGTIENALSSFTMTFSEPVTSLSLTDFFVTGPGGEIPVTSIANLGGPMRRINFPTQLAQGNYTLTVGPNINDFAGNPMNQDGDAANGEPEDAFTITVYLQDNGPPTVTRVTPSGSISNDVSSVTIQFDEPLLAGSFTTDDLALSGPGGAIPVTSLTQSNSTTWIAGFATQTTVGTYPLTIGPAIEDVLSNAMTAAYQTSFTIDRTGPGVTAMSPSGGVTQAVSFVDITFNEAIDAGTVSTADVSLSGPSGAVVISSAFSFASNRFRITFPQQTASGAYTLTFGPSSPILRAIS